MNDTQRSAAARAVTLERFPGPVEERTEDGGRSASIAAIRALAVFFEEHPELPVPTYVASTSHTIATDEFEALCRQHDRIPYGTHARQFDVDVAPLEVGCWVQARFREAHDGDQ